MFVRILTFVFYLLSLFLGAIILAFNGMYRKSAADVLRACLFVP